MAADGKKEFKVNLKADPLKEMHKKAKQFISDNPVLKKVFEPFTYSDKVELDPRKWKQSTLDEGVYAVARYPMKLLAARTLDLIEKADYKFSPSLVKALTKEHKEVAKEIEDRVSLALEELASDKGDNKKGLRDGKAAFNKLKSADLTEAFSGPRDTIVKGFTSLAQLLRKAGQDDKKKNSAYSNVATTMEGALKSFNGNAKEAEAAVAYLLKVADGMTSNTAASTALKEFGEKIEKKSSDFREFLSHISAFDTDINAAVRDVKQKTLDADQAEAKARDFAKHVGLDKEGISIQSVVKSLEKDFAKVEKELK